MMTKSFYQYACFSLGLNFAAGLFGSWLHVQLGTDMYMLSSFGSWFLVTNLISLSTSLVVLTYYYSKKYQAAFVTSLVATLAALVGFIFLLLLLAMVNRDLVRYTSLIYFLAIGTGLIYAISLFVSEAKNRPWLRRAGFLLAILSVIQLATLIWFIDIPPYPVNASLDKITQWIALAERLFPVLLIINFVSEYRFAVVKRNNDSFSRLDIVKGGVAVLALCFLILSVRLAGESYDHTHLSSKTIALAQPFETGSYINGQGDTLLYRILRPLHYDPQKKYPLVVCLPYTCADDNVRQIRGCPPAQWLAKQENRTKYEAFLFVPRCPPNTGWGGMPNTPSVDSMTIEAILSLDKRFSIDSHRRYVTGVSRGGYGSWHFMSTHPELFAAAIPVCGEGNPTQAKNMANRSVWAFHGAKDRNVPVSGSREMIAAIKKAGGRPRYTEYPDAAHSIWEEVEKTPGLSDWLFAQKLE